MLFLPGRLRHRVLSHVRTIKSETTSVQAMREARASSGGKKMKPYLLLRVSQDIAFRRDDDQKLIV